MNDEILKYLPELIKRKAINMAKIEKLFIFLSFFISFLWILSFDMMEKNKVVGD